MSKEQLIKAIGLPKWKQDFIRKNRLLYTENKRFINRCAAKGEDGMYGYESCAKSCHACDASA